MAHLASISRSSSKDRDNPRKKFSTFSKMESLPPTGIGKRVQEKSTSKIELIRSIGDDGDDVEGPIPIQAVESRSIEIFFGKFTTFQTFHQALCDHGVSVPGEVQDGCTTKVKPESIKKLVMVGHPMISFSGMNSFTKLSEAWVTNCKIGEARWADFEGMKALHKLFIHNCSLDKLEPLHFQNLRVLWVASNRLTSLNFLAPGLPSLNELNAANNEITCLHEEQLFKCVNLHTLNVSGNPLCTVQDVQAAKVLGNLQTLYLADPMYGKCPVAALCDSRTMLLSIFTNVRSLDGKSVSPAEHVAIQDYVNSRSLFYYANCVQAVASQVALRKSAISTTHKNMESIGQRLTELLTMASKFRRATDSVDIVPASTNAKSMLRDYLQKMEARATKLRELAAITNKRLETIMQISRWEQEAEKWMKWIEFQSYGNMQCHIIQSVHGPRVDDSVQLCGCIHQMISALSCPNLWPQNTITKVETVIVIKDKGMEAGMERTYEDNFSKLSEPVFIPPPPETPVPIESHNQIFAVSGQGYPFYSSPVPPSKPIPTYTTLDYKPSPPLHNFPDSVPGLPEKMQPLYMFLVCPPSTSMNPLTFLHRIITEKSRYYKEVRVTNCLWLATNLTRGVNNFAVVVVVKVLSECLQAIQTDKRISSVHTWDCTLFSMKKPLTLAPAYILNISFTIEDKQNQWNKGPSNDEDILGPAKTSLASLTGKINTYKFPPGTKRRSKRSPFIRKVCDGIQADLSSIQLYKTMDGTVDCVDPLTNDGEENVPEHSRFDIQNVCKFLGAEATQFITALDLSGNKLGLTLGLEGLNSLKKLNLSHNNLTTLSGFQKLPTLLEFKAGWNYLRFLHSNACTLAWAAPRLMTLEILPNPFQDIRDHAHIPILLRKTLPALHRVDIWTAPFNCPSSLTKFNPPMVADAGFAHVAMAKSWVGTAHSYNDLASRCLTDLEPMAASPPFPEGFGSNGMDLNISDNYLNAHALTHSPFVRSVEWRTCIVKLQLQENMIASLEWMTDVVFPNVQILNLSNNHITDVELIPNSFPALRYLQLGGNPLQSDTSILSPIRLLANLNTLDCSYSPLASNPDYGGYVSKFLPSIQILDGIPMESWILGESVERLGGVLTQDWLEEKIGHRNFSCLDQLAFANSNLQKISLPAHSLSKLISLDLQDNYLSTLTNLAALPSLRVLCASHNSISALGSQPCPTCFTHTAESQAINAQKLRSSRTSAGLPESLMGTLQSKFHGSNDSHDASGSSTPGRTHNNTKSLSNTKYSPPLVGNQVRKPKPLAHFSKMEVLVMAHNGLSALSDLHLHSMPTLQTVILNCNNLTSFQGLNDIPTVRALVLDNNKIKDVPHNSLIGCNSLRFLHLEHNRIAALPRLPHLTNLTSLYLSYNKIHSLTDLNGVASAIKELSLTGNPITARSDYRLNLKAKAPHLQVVDGFDVSTEQSDLNLLTKLWFPGTANVIREYASHDPVFRSQQSSESEKSWRIEKESEFGLKVRSLSPHLANASPRRALQFSAAKRPDYI